MKAKSIYGDSTASIRSALDQSLVDGFTPGLAIVFISIRQSRTELVSILREHNIDVVGATSCGEFTEVQHSEAGTVILLLELSRHYYRVLFVPIGEKSIAEAAKQIAQQALEIFANPSLIVCSTGMNRKGEYFDGISLSENLTVALGVDKTFVGGMAGDDGSFSGSYVFTSTQETDFGCVALVLDSDKIDMLGAAVTGWKPMGISRIVTKSKGNLLYSIDNKSAVEMYLKYLGKEGAEEDKEFSVLKELSFSFPFIVDRGDGGTLVKSPLRIDHQENALVTDMEMPEGTRFWFSTPPDFEIVEEVIAEARTFKNETNFLADALLIFSCAGRPPVLGPLVTQENEGLAEVWQSPMAGFFTYGEYGRTKNGPQHFHSTACCWVALKEK